MSSKQIDVTCPCCSTVLTVDVLTRQVLKRVEPTERASGSSDDRWGAAQERVAGRPEASQDKLDRMLAEERGKEDRLDELFRKANEKLSRKEDDEE